MLHYYLQDVLDKANRKEKDQLVLQKNRRIKEKELNQKRRAAIGNNTAIDRPAKLRKTRSEEVTEDSNKENRQPDLLTQEVTEGTRICTGYTMVKTNEEGAPSKNKKGDAVIKLEYTQFSPEAFHDLVRDKEKSKKTIIDMNKVITEQKRLNDSYQRGLTDFDHAAAYQAMRRAALSVTDTSCDSLILSLRTSLTRCVPNVGALGRLSIGVLFWRSPFWTGS